MKKLIFTLSTLGSLLSFVFAAYLFNINYSEESPGMIMVFLIPSLLIGLVLGIATIFLKDDLELSRFMTLIHKFNVFLIGTGAFGLVYRFIN